ncbi:telomere repeat-binding factor 4 isoform X2 [Raphanus sativus]|uniref:MYB transcription factor n=1 Tax=Raphanus sativus TaxID=3726 RepID=A0A6J0KBR3_RAPSA|nr:telomere repeat-binding factor 4 isoform X2 [Raphanus sativus]
MGKEKSKWTEDEEDALLAGVKKHGPGKWKNILRDPDFSTVLSLRSNIDLKDKWRNLSVPAEIQGSKDKVRTPKIKAAAFQLAAAATTPTPSSASSPVAPPPLPRSGGSSDLSIGDSCNMLIDAKNAPRYDGMIFEALSALKDSNGSDVTTIFNFIEQKMYEVPEQFKRVLGSRLRRLAAQGKLEKTQNFYRMNNNSFLAMRTPVAAKPKEGNGRHRQTGNSQGGLTVSQEKIDLASGTAAYKLYEVDGKLEALSGVVDERERMTELSEQAEIMLLLAEELHERCCRGEIVELN